MHWKTLQEDLFKLVINKLYQQLTLNLLDEFISIYYQIFYHKVGKLSFLGMDFHFIVLVAHVAKLINEISNLSSCSHVFNMLFLVMHL